MAHFHLPTMIRMVYNRPAHASPRLVPLMLLPALVMMAAPRTALASPASLRMPCAAASAPNTVLCRLSGQGFLAGERISITYRVALDSSPSRLLSTRTDKTDGRGTFSRPQLGFNVQRDGQRYQVTAVVKGTQHKARISVSGVYRRPVQAAKRIVVSVSAQRLTAYDGQRQVLTTLVATGNRVLTPTPPGRYAVLARYSPLRFISPWPYGHPYWYAPSWTSYALSFRQDGYFIHDAPWRSVYGPASQSGGAPGTNFGGTHGCINVPLSAARFLYGWAAPGTEVDVVA